MVQASPLGLVVTAQPSCGAYQPQPVQSPGSYRGEQQDWPGAQEEGSQPDPGSPKSLLYVAELHLPQPGAKEGMETGMDTSLHLL